MIKDVFKLSKNSWHMKLMSYIWGFKHYDFSHICPYFWLSFLNLIIIVPYFLVAECIVRPIIKASIAYERWIDRLDEEQTINFLERLKTDPEFKTKWLNACYSDWNKKKNKVVKWNLNWYGAYKDMFSEFWTERDKFQEKKHREFIKTIPVTNEEDEAAKKKRRKEMITKISNVFKPIGKVLIVLLSIAGILGVSWLIYLGIKGLMNIKHTSWINFFKSMGIIAIGVTIVIGVVLGIRSIILNINIGCKTRDRIGFTFSLITKPFVFIAVGIYRFFELLVVIVKNNCPAIHWDK